MPLRVNQETAVIPVASSAPPAQAGNGDSLPHVNAWRLARRFGLNPTGKHVLNVGLSKFETQYRRLGMTVDTFSRNLAHYMCSNGLVPRHFSPVVFEMAVREYVCTMADGDTPS